MNTLFVAARALVYVTGFVLLWGWMALAVRRFDRDLGISLPGWTEKLAVALAPLGGILVLTCVGAFIVIGRGTPAVFDAPREFVAIGPYRHVRNPMYIGACILLLSFGLYQHSISILVLSFLAFVLFHLFVVYFEEPTLRGKFRATYEVYYKSVPRWIPRW